MADNSNTIPTYPHAVAPECDCEIGAVCPHWACCYADEAVPDNVRSELVAPATKPDPITDPAVPSGASPMSACAWCSADYGGLAERLRAAGWTVTPPLKEVTDAE